MYAEVIVDIAHSNVDKIYEYSCGEGVVAGSRVKVPFGGRVVDGFVVGVSATSAYPPEKIKPVSFVYDEPPALVEECFFLMNELAARYRVPKAVCLRLFLPAEMRAGRVHEVYKKLVKPLDLGISLPKSAKKQAEFLQFLKGGEAEYTACCERFGRGAVNAVIEKGGAELLKVKINRTPASFGEGAEQPRQLTPAQRDAIDKIEGSPKTVHLIHGVTGSGKTEIYLNIISRALQQGKTAIFLVPEISLTPQMFSQLKRRFGEKAAILHSGLSAGERFDEWWRLRTGEARIAIGARSAIFSPLENIGAIIIDEEHDGSYFSESAPRYSTAEVAKMRARHNGCKLILGSATPSVETYSRAVSGEYNLITLTQRINGRPLPDITIADMRKEVKRGNSSSFSSALREELKDTLQSGNQAIIFLNRRGYSHTVICQDCGYALKCEHCDVALAYHSEEDCLKCHYCGAKYRLPRACPECGGLHLRYGGTGTQRVVSDLKKLFPSARILRMDNDTTSGKEGHYKILKEFGEKKADILVGTQMIAKGHDFPKVTLVGILDGDQSLHHDDYMACERTFQLITQVAGRSGRSQDAGRVVLQTYTPNHYCLSFAAKQDYAGFYRREISVRETAGFPPFTEIVRILYQGEEEKACIDELTEQFARLGSLRAQRADAFLYLDKMRCPLKRAERKFRFQILMKLKKQCAEEIIPLIYQIINEKQRSGVSVFAERNPQNLS